MNRTLVITISILLAFCAGIYFWTEWQKKEFDASLPEPPAVEEQQVADDTAGGHWHGDEWHADDAHAQDDWQPSAGNPHEVVKPEGLDELDADDPVARAWAKLDYITENPFAWGGNADPRTAGLVQQLMPPIDGIESEAHAEEIFGLLNPLARLRDPRSIETLVAYECGGHIGSAEVIDALVAMGPPVVPYLIPYLDKEDGMGVYLGPDLLGQIGAQHRGELGGIIEHIILPKLAKQLEMALTDPFPVEIRIRGVEEAIARLKR